MSIPLTDIVLTTKHFDDTSFSWSSVPWIYAQIPWRIRMLVRWSIAPKWWKDKYILPIIKAKAEPHLQRFATGRWRQHEEEKLLMLFEFFQPRKELFSSEASLFLSGVAPSFVAERGRVQRLSQKEYGSLAWYRDEYFSHYKERLFAVTQKVQRPPAAPRLTTESPQPRDRDHVSAATKTRAEKTLAACNSLHDAVYAAIQKIEQLLKASFPLRLEAEGEIDTLQHLQKQGWALTSQIDAILSSIPEYISNEPPLTEKFLRAILDETEELLLPLQTQLDEVTAQLQRTARSIETIRAALQKQLQLLSRSTDKASLLPQTSSLRSQQMQLIKSAREKVKRFRTALSKGPGPGISFQMLSQQANHLLELAMSFYNEGIEIESLREQGNALKSELEQSLSTEKDPSRIQRLQTIATELEELLTTLDVASNRKVRLEALCEEMAQTVEMKEPV